MRKLMFLTVLLSAFISCDRVDDMVARPETVAETTASEVKEVTTKLPELSIYNLPTTWTNQDNQDLELEELRGKVLVMVMIYTSCKSACPRLLADMRNIEKQVPKEDLDELKFIMVSINPETDTPERLHAFAKDNMMEDGHWMFLRGTKEDTREFAAVLAVNYKQISPIDFSHSNIISVFDEDGVLVHQQEGLGVDNVETVASINEEVNN